jgi:phosphatidylglycerophosphatase A
MRSKNGKGKELRGRILDVLSLALATGFGSGYSPVAPGTAGSLLAAILAFISRGHSLLFYGLLGIFLLPGTLAADRAERLLGQKDPSRVVVDEMAGIFLSAMLVPARDYGLFAAALCFGLFRLFDIWKPWPVSKVQDLPGGYGIMADDILAGLLAGAISRIVILFTGRIC